MRRMDRGDWVEEWSRTGIPYLVAFCLDQRGGVTTVILSMHDYTGRKRIDKLGDVSGGQAELRLRN